MNKPNDRSDIIFDLLGFMIDGDNQRMQEEIQWLKDNYNNHEELRRHFLKRIPIGSDDVKVLYVNQLSGYDAERLQNMATLRANILYDHICKNKQRKEVSEHLKSIIEILKLIEK